MRMQVYLVKKKAVSYSKPFNYSMYIQYELPGTINTRSESHKKGTVLFLHSISREKNIHYIILKYVNSLL